MIYIKVKAAYKEGLRGLDSIILAKQKKFLLTNLAHKNRKRRGHKRRRHKTYKRQIRKIKGKKSAKRQVRKIIRRVRKRVKRRTTRAKRRARAAPLNRNQQSALALLTSKVDHLTTLVTQKMKNNGNQIARKKATKPTVKALSPKVIKKVANQIDKKDEKILVSRVENIGMKVAAQLEKEDKAAGKHSLKAKKQGLKAGNAAIAYATKLIKKKVDRKLGKVAGDKILRQVDKIAD